MPIIAGDYAFASFDLVPIYGRIRVCLNPKNLGKALGRRGCRMDVKCPKSPAKREVLLTGELLVPKENHLIL